MKKINYTFISISITYILIIFLGIIYFSFLEKQIPIPTCPFYTHLGIFCPACGGTRAIISLLNFDLLSSFYYNPIVLYTIFFTTLYLITELINLFFNKKINIPFNFILKFGIFILFSNCIIRNILILF